MKRKPQRTKKTLSIAEKNIQAEVTAVPASYATLLTEIKERVRRAQLRAHLAVSRELVSLYWQIGRDIVSRQNLEGWGKSVIERLAADIQKAFPGVEGFSPLNLWRMRAFYLAYAEEDGILSQAATEFGAERTSPARKSNLSPPVTELDAPPPTGEPSPILAQAVQEIPPSEVLAVPWSHNLILCREKNRVIAEYALRDIQKPVGVSGYFTRLVETLPAPIKDAVPSVAELECSLTDFSE